MMSASSLVIELLDTESGHVLQNWELMGSDVYQLGRSRDCDVVLASPFVSRTHVCLQWTDDGWNLSAVSRGGVFVEGRRVDNLHLQDGVVFRLAERGPSLRFRSAQADENKSAGETICFDSDRTLLLVLDEQQRDREVAEIADGDYFRELQRKVALLRTRSSSSEPGSPGHRS